MALCRMVLDPSDASMQVSAYRSDESRGGTHISDLPLAVLSRILSQILDPVSAAHVICSCRMFRVLSKSVPFSFKVSCTKLENKVEVEERMQKKHNLTDIRTWTRRLLSSVRSQMPMTKVLDLSGCWIVDEDVAAVLADLRCLKCLILDGCQKLTSAVADALAVSVRLGPRALSLQRCFGLCPAAAGNLLAAAAAEGSQLQCILLSHLDRLDLPRYPPLLEAQESDVIEATKSAGTLNAGSSYNSHGLTRRELNNITNRSFGISVLALHNCGNFGAHELAAVGVTCPHLEFLLIGGSIEALRLSRPDSSSSEVSTMAVTAIVESLKFLRCLRVLEATFFPEFVIQGLRGQVGEGVEVWDFCERKSVCSAIRFLSSQVASEQVFHGRNKIRSFQASKAKWNFDGINETEDYVSLALRAAVNCSDLRRRTPLHVAANEADTEMVRGLLSMGASLRLKDSTGATALFDAAWNGHADICQLLLIGGADMLSRNRSGENSLYAAALKGHTSVVKIFVSHCKANNIDWQSAEVYGDGWTPLMAAAVADRHDVAKVLLEAAGLCLSLDCTIKDCLFCKKDIKGPGKKCSMEQEREAAEHKNEDAHLQPNEMPTTNTSSQILDAQNRYGQTALHIAARRGSEWFVSYLLHVGASLNIGDEYKKRPVDVAQKQKHTVVTNLIKQWELQLKRAQLGNGCDVVSARERLATDKFTVALSHTNSESFPVKGSCKGGLRSAALKQVWRPKEKKGLL